MSESNKPRLIPRVEVSSRKADQLRGAVREMLAGYPYLGSLASSDSIAYHGVRTNAFRWIATDGVSVMLNDTPDGFFSDPGHVPVPAMDDATAQAAGLTPGEVIPPNLHSNRAPLSPDERVFAVAHEILHVAREDVLWKHVYSTQGWVPVPRSSEAPDGRLDYDEAIFEDTCDAQINSALLADGVGKPHEQMVKPVDGIDWNTPFGDAYAKMYEVRKKLPPPPGPGGSGQGQGQGNPPPSGGQGPRKQNQGGGDILQPGQGGDPWDDSTDPSNPGTQPGDAQVAAQQIEAGRAEREAMHKRAQQTARMAGTGSSAVESMVLKAREPQVDWKSYIQGFLSRTGGVSAWDWHRPSRPPLLRSDPYFAPARGGHGVGHIVVAMDVSGSIQAPEIRVFLAIISEMLDALRPKKLSLLFVNSAVVRVDEPDPTDSFESYDVPMGGGTSFKPAFRWAAELGEEDKPDALLYLTDLEGDAPNDAPDYPVLWCNINQHRQRPMSGGQWGEVIYVPVSELQPEGA